MNHATNKALGRNLYLLVATLLVLWVASVTALAWWNLEQTQRSSWLNEYFRPAAGMAEQLADSVSKLSAADFREQLASPRDTLNSLLDLENRVGRNPPENALARMKSIFVALEGAPPTRTTVSITGLLENASVRAEQLNRLYALRYDEALEEALSRRYTDSVTLIISVGTLTVVALLLVGIILRQTRTLARDLSDSNEQLQSAIRLAGLGYSRWSPGRRDCLRVSGELAGMFGCTEREFLRRYATFEDYREAVAPEDRADFTRQAHGSHDSLTYRVTRTDGQQVYLQERVDTLASGELLVSTLDVTDLKEAEARSLHTQKMELIGQLTGGIAHDFNNLLSIMSGSLELMAGLDEKQAALREMALQATERGARLTSHLLAFARKQPLLPEALPVGDILRRLADVYRQIMPENIEIAAYADTDTWSCNADAMQLEGALTNLIVNARDAMPTGGKLTLEASNVHITAENAAIHEDFEPGEYVRIAVSDTGEGIDTDELERIFDPYYTTKPTDRGTGLGLSMVYGFSKQSGGHVNAYSEPGSGSTFSLYLPRADAGASEATPAPAAATDEQWDLRVLVVEDEPDVRRIVEEQTRQCGYRVSAVENAEAALALLEKESYDILLTDLVLNGKLNGKQLAERVTALAPDYGVVFMSGYTQNAVVHHGRLDEGVLLLQKPFSKNALAEMLRRAHPAESRKRL